MMADCICMGKGKDRPDVTVKTVRCVRDTFQHTPHQSNSRGRREINLHQITFTHCIQKRVLFKTSQVSISLALKSKVNHLTPNGNYMGRTAALTSRCCILYIYSTNIRTEYFKHAA